MNKKGFTLIEVIVSVVLVSIVMVTLTSTLVELKKKSETVAINTNAVIYSSVISRIINSDVANNNGIKFIECDPNGSECGMVLGNNDKRTLSLEFKDSTNSAPVKIEKVDATGNYIMKTKNGNNYVDRIDMVIVNGGNISYCNNDGDKLFSNCLAAIINGNKCSCFKERISSTLAYKDITSETTTGILNSNTTSGKVKYMKTLSYIKITDPDTGKISTEGYGFSRLNHSQNPYTGKNGEVNVLTKLELGIYDGIDKNEAIYNVNLYSASRLDDTTPSVGDKFTITVDSVGNMPSPHDLTYPLVESEYRAGMNFPITRLTEKFNIGFEAVNPGMMVGTEVNVGMGETQTFRKFDVLPTYPGKTFGGYFSAPNGASACTGTMVINTEGKLVVASNYFMSDSTIYACWN